MGTCGQLCVPPALVPFLFFAPKPTPVKGDCASFGFPVDTGKSFDLIPEVPDGFEKVRIFKRPNFAISAGRICKSGYSPITSKWEDCKAAAVALGFSGDSVGFVDYMGNFADRPQGCFESVDGGRVHFNNGPGGSGRRGDSIICSITK